MRSLFTGMIVVLLIAVAASWVGLGLYNALSTSEVDPNAQTYLKPIEPEFDSEVLTDLETRVNDLPVSPDVFHEIEEEAVISDETSTEETSEEE